MPAIARIGDPATQHPCGGQANPAEGSPNVFVEGIAVHRLGDSNVAHSCPSYMRTSFYDLGFWKWFCVC